MNKSASMAKVDDNHYCLTVSTAKNSREGSSIKSPTSTGSGKEFPKEESPIIHCPPSISSLEQFSPQRRAWIQNWGNSNAELNDVLKSGQAWDTIESRFIHSGYSNPNEATGLLFVQLIQVTNKATAKIFDVEWTLRVAGLTNLSASSVSSDVNEPFQLEMTVAESPLPNKLGTMAGLSNSQASVRGQLEMPFFLEPMDKSIRTYRLGRPTIEDAGRTSVKADCEVVVMIGLHVLEEPVEDRSWETEMLYQGFLTFMTRGGRMASWKRYWAVLEGCSVKLYDAEYQQRRNVIGVIPLARILRVQPPDYEKVDVGANGFSMVAGPDGVDMGSGGRQVDRSELDYCLYAFTDSTHLHEVWSAHLEEAMDQFQDNMARPKWRVEPKVSQDTWRRRRRRRRRVWKNMGRWI
ncbi:MAG: hypothetical protein J3Q66DRAFT_446266 [Benniella sp.]|nr:MAG: hypothetical protein J3Q66DRAFT_446266 [Benniella sp.]